VKTKSWWVINHPPLKQEGSGPQSSLLSQRAATETKLPRKTEKQTVNSNKTWTVEGVGGTEPATEKGDGANKKTLSTEIP
jgi:hypothetical protein